MNSTIIDNATTSAIQEALAFRLQGVDHLPVMAQDEVCPIIKQYFDYLEQSLTAHDSKVDIGLLQEMLLEISLLLRSGKGLIRKDGYLRMLNRLTAIYAKGLQTRDDYAFARTAANFADILESVSHQFQDYDYRHPVSLLLHYMDKLFKIREESWLEVYEHLVSMPETIHILQQLRLDHIDEINTWIEEGVDNLFTLREEQLDVIGIQEHSLRDLDQQILTRKAQLERSSSHDGVIDIRRAGLLRTLDELSHQRQQLLLDCKNKREIVSLLDTNIEEFSDRLARMRRSTVMKLVWSNPQRR